MTKLRITVVLLALVGALNSWSQGFGNRELINADWYFNLGDIKYGGSEYFDHSEWRKLELPHDWSVEAVASPELASCTGYLPGGIGWYRKDLDIPKVQNGNKVYIYFEGIYNNSEVFINGKWIGKRPNGYVSFMYELTPYLKFGGRNVLAVRVDHSQDADSRWYTGSGIYRDVYLVYANPVHIRLWGVSYSAKVNKKNAVLSVQTEVDNTGKLPVAVKVLHEVFDRDGKKVGAGSLDYSLRAGEMVKKELAVSIVQPKLWSLEDPYLYTIRTTLSKGGKVIDRTETRAGIRSLTFDPNKGFALNGKFLKVKGVCIGGPHTTGSPVRKGFDYFFGYLSQGAAHRYYPEYLYENEDKVMLNKKVYSHFLIMEKGLNFIRENAHHPFFAYFAITPPHADLDYPDLGQYEDAFPETPFINNKQKGFKTQMKPKAAYASMVSEIDKNVGQIIRLLKEKGIWENTIFIFSSDNGVHCVGGHEPDFFDSNGPYRGYKRDLYEGGVRAPFIVNWPKMIKEKKTVEHITAFWDFLPTVTELVGAKKVKGIDGISYLPLLIGNGDVARNHEYIYYEFYEQGGKQSILKDGWKLVRLNMSKPGELQEELYYLPDDVGEEKNLIRQNSPKADELRKLAMKARTESEYFKWEEKK